MLPDRTVIEITVGAIGDVLGETLRHAEDQGSTYFATGQAIQGSVKATGIRHKEKRPPRQSVSVDERCYAT